MLDCPQAMDSVRWHAWQRARRPPVSLPARAAATYWSRNAGEILSAAAILSKPFTSILGGQQIVGVDLYTQQILHGDSVFRPCHALDSDVAGNGTSRWTLSSAVSSEWMNASTSAWSRLAAARRRHQAASQFSHGLFPDLRVISDVVQRHSGECDAAGLRPSRCDSRRNTCPACSESEPVPSRSAAPPEFAQQAARCQTPEQKA